MIPLRAASNMPGLRVWRLLVVCFLSGWLIFVAGFGGWRQVAAHWPMGLVMAAGSVVAGSTPMGGGAVSFPILVYFFGTSPAHARTFGLAIQALGMTSALVFILSRRMRIETRLLLTSCAGAAAGMILGTFLVGPLVRGEWVKLLFACLWMSFALLTLAKNSEICSLKGQPDLGWKTALETGLPIGILGGLIASMIGVGLELLIYTVLVLAFRCDMKVAIPTAVCATAVTSVIGISLHAGMHDIPQPVVGEWIAAAPIVVFGAPIGAYVASRASRIKLLYFISALCVFQFLWALKALPLGPAQVLFVVTALAAASGGFIILYRTGTPRTVARAKAAASQGHAEQSVIPAESSPR